MSPCLKLWSSATGSDVASRSELLVGRIMQWMATTIRRFKSIPVFLPQIVVRECLRRPSACFSSITPEFSQDTVFASLIDGSTHFSHLAGLHAKMLILGLLENSFLLTKLVHACSDLGDIRYARKMFDEYPHPDVFLWNAIIRGYSRHGMFTDAIGTYSEMLCAGVKPDGFTFPYVLKASTVLPTIVIGRRVHGQVFRHGLESDLFVQNGVVALYTKCADMASARILFDQLGERTVVTWTLLISGYSQNGRPVEALKLFRKMREDDIYPDWIVLVSVLRAYSDIEDLEQGQSLHGCIVKMGLEDEPDLLISLTSMYAKGGQVTVARTFFDRMDMPNLILWNAMISGYARSGCGEEAVVLFRDLVSRNVRPDSITISSAILACAQVGLLELARWMDVFVHRSDYSDDTIVNTALIDMYSKCGSVQLAREVFERTKDKDVVMWSAMIVGYGLHGKGQEAIELYRAMKKAGICPNDVTFIGLLMACNHSGLLKDGWDLFHQMRDYGIEPRHQHYACVVDLLGRAGHLREACNFILKMPIEPGVSVWGALLSACKIHRDVGLGEYAADQLFSVGPNSVGHYVQLSNLYASLHQWDGVAKIRVLMKERGLSKDLSYSSIQVSGKLESG